MLRQSLKSIGTQVGKPSTSILLSSLKHTPRSNAAFSTHTSPKEKEETTFDKITLPSETLNEGYAALHQRLNDVVKQALMAALISPTLSGIWLLATDQMLLESPVAMASLLCGGMFVTERVMQKTRVQKYAKLSTILNPTPSISEDDNTRIKKIIAGENPKITFNTKGLTVSGPKGELKHLAQAVQHAISRTHSIGRVVLPSCVLTNKADSLAALATERWLARINMPLAVLNIVLIASKASKQRTIDDYVILGTSATSIYDYFNGPSVAEARNKLTKALSNCDTPEAILKFFVDNEILDKGGMSFLKTWIENQNSIGVRVGRTSSPVLYKNRSLSFGGPYPIHLFPQKRTQNDENTSEVMVPKKRF